MLSDRSDPRANAVIRTAFEIGFSTDGVVGPLHLLVALSEDDGAAAALLRPPGNAAGLRGIVFADLGPSEHGAMTDFRAGQVMGSAGQWATTDDTTVTPEHLLLALVEQGDPDVVSVCLAHRINLAAARQRAMDTLHWLSVPPLLPLTAAGTRDRPPLPLELLPKGVWAELLDRQRRLPISRLRHAWQAYALCDKERRMATRIVDRHDLNDDERCSLLHYHYETVKRSAAEAVPEILPPPGPRSGFVAVTAVQYGRHRRLRRFYNRYFFWLAGWACWFGNRRAGLRDRWFRLTWRY